MIRLFRTQGPAAQRRAMVCSFVTEGKQAPLFCHGGNPDLGIYLGGERSVYWLFPHGMDGYPVPATIEAMAQDYLPEICRIRPHGPYFFLGCSLGGLVMLEIARRLIEKGEIVAMLAMIDTALPENVSSLPEPAGEGAEPEALAAIRRQRTRSARRSHADLAWEFSAQTGRRLRWATRLAKRTACDGVVRVGARLPPFARPFYFFAKTEQVIARYVPRQYNGPLVVFRRPGASGDQQWRALAGGSLELHDTWLEPNEISQLPYVHILAEQIKKYMRRAERQLSAPAALPQTYLSPPAEVTSAVFRNASREESR